MIWEFSLTILIGYLLGAIPFGLIIGKLVRGIDVRQYGSGNIGFTNVLRSVGARAGVVTLFFDVGKGVLGAWLGGQIVGGDAVAAAQVVGGLAAVVGHNWSIYLKFIGGKGVGTALGALMAMSLGVGVVCLLIGIGLIVFTRYVSVGSMFGAASSIPILIPLVIFGNAPVEYLIYGIIVTILIVIRHRSNIVSLRAGNERKFGQGGAKV